MAPLERISVRLGKFAAWLSCLVMVYMVVHILYEIVLRVWFAKSTYVLDEFVAYATGAMTFLCLSYSMKEGTLIRVNMFLVRLKGRVLWGFELFSTLVAFLTTILIIYFFWTKTYWRDITQRRLSESIAEVPLWVPETFAMVGLVLFCLQLVVMLLKLFRLGTRAVVPPKME